jgi:hypothetical protein
VAARTWPPPRGPTLRVACELAATRPENASFVRQWGTEDFATFAQPVLVSDPRARPGSPVHARERDASGRRRAYALGLRIDVRSVVPSICVPIHRTRFLWTPDKRLDDGAGGGPRCRWWLRGSGRTGRSSSSRRTEPQSLPADPACDDVEGREPRWSGRRLRPSTRSLMSVGTMPTLQGWSERFRPEPLTPSQAATRPHDIEQR